MTTERKLREQHLNALINGWAWLAALTEMKLKELKEGKTHD